MMGLGDILEKIREKRIRNFSASSLYTCALLAGVLFLAGWLRFLDLSSYPGIYNDEGNSILLAKNILQGRLEYSGITDSILLAGRMPLFPLVLSLFLSGQPHDLLTVRSLSAVSGLACIPLLFLLTKRLTQNQSTAIISSLLFAVYPAAVIYNRMGFSYNFLPPLVLLECLGLWEYSQNKKIRWLVISSTAVGFGLLVDLEMAAFLPALLLIVAWRKWRHLLIALGVAFAPVALFFAGLLLKFPQETWFDVQFLVFRVGGNSILEQVLYIFLNFYLLLDVWLGIALVGFLLSPGLNVKRYLIFFFFIPFFVIARNLGLVGLTRYYTLPIMPFIPLGVAITLSRAVEVIHKIAYKEMGNIPTSRLSGLAAALLSGILIFILTISPFLLSTGMLIRQIQEKEALPIEFATLDFQDAVRVADFINTNTSVEDLVISSPALAWLFKSHIADYQVALAASGMPTVHFPAIPPQRFKYPVSFEKAHFILVDPIWTGWGETAMPDLKDIRKDIQSRWNLIYSSGPIQVFENPAYAPNSTPKNGI